jgi:hypothetical protein
LSESDPTTQPPTMGLADVAYQLGVNWRSAWWALLRGDLEGWKGPNGRWLVTLESVARFKERRGEGAAA